MNYLQSLCVLFTPCSWQVIEATGRVRTKSASTRSMLTRGDLLMKCTPSWGTIEDAEIKYNNEHDPKQTPWPPLGLTNLKVNGLTSIGLAGFLIFTPK